MLCKTRLQVAYLQGHLLRVVGWGGYPLRAAQGSPAASNLFNVFGKLNCKLSMLSELHFLLPGCT